MRLERYLSGARYLTLTRDERETLARAAALLESIRELAPDGSTLDIDTAIAADTVSGLAGYRARDTRGIELEP